MSKHVIKHTHNNGERLEKPTLWCGRKYNGFDWVFQDTHHVALAVEGSIQPCKSCIKSIIRELEKEL